MVNWIVVQVCQNLCVVENPVGKTNSHVRKATESLVQLNSHLSPMLHKFWPLLIHPLFVPGRNSFVYQVFCQLPDLGPNDDIR